MGPASCTSLRVYCKKKEMHGDLLHPSSQRRGPVGLGCSGGHFLQAETFWCAQVQGGGHQLPSAVPLSAPASAWSGHIQACGMQPAKGLKALKCSFSKRPAFLKCQRSWKRQLAPLPAAQAEQPGLNMTERCLCSPNKLGVPGKCPCTLLCVPPNMRNCWARRQKKPKHHLPPMFSSQCRKGEITEPSRAVFSLCQ